MRKSHGSSAARRLGSGSTQPHAGSSWNARASTALASPSWPGVSRTISTERHYNCRCVMPRFGPGFARRPPPLRRLDLEDLELERAARCRDLDDVALLVTHDRLPDRRLVGELVLRRIRLRRADDVVLERLVRRDVAQPHGRADRHGVFRDLLL